MTDEEKTKYVEVEADEDEIILMDKDGEEIVTLDMTESLEKLGYIKEKEVDDDDDKKNE